MFRRPGILQRLSHYKPGSTSPGVTWVSLCHVWSPAWSPRSGTEVPNGHPCFAGGADALPKPSDRQRSPELAALDSECSRCSEPLRRSPGGGRERERSCGSLSPQKQLEKSLLLLPGPPTTRQSSNPDLAGRGCCGSMTQNQRWQTLPMDFPN